MPPRRLAGVQTLGTGGGFGEQVAVHQTVVDQDLRALQAT
jgi:hypothetical protein